MDGRFDLSLILAVSHFGINVPQSVMAITDRVHPSGDTKDEPDVFHLLISRFAEHNSTVR
jgi:hypothetical protein